MPTKKTAPTLADLQAEAAAAQAALAEAEAIAAREAEEAAAKAQAERLERCEHLMTEFPRIDSALTDRRAAAEAARMAAVSALDFQAMIDAETGVHRAVAAANVVRNAYNFARLALLSVGRLDPATAPTERPDRRERRVTLFAVAEEGDIARAIKARAASQADDLVAEVLDALGLPGDLVEGI